MLLNYKVEISYSIINIIKSSSKYLTSGSELVANEIYLINIKYFNTHYLLLILLTLNVCKMDPN